MIVAYSSVTKGVRSLDPQIGNILEILPELCDWLNHSWTGLDWEKGQDVPEGVWADLHHQHLDLGRYLFSNCLTFEAVKLIWHLSVGCRDAFRTCSSDPVLTTYLCCLSLPRADQAPKSRQSIAIPGAPSRCETTSTTPCHTPPTALLTFMYLFYLKLHWMKSLQEQNLFLPFLFMPAKSPTQEGDVLVPCSSALPRKSSKQPLSPWPCWVSCTHTHSQSR